MEKFFFVLNKISNSITNLNIENTNYGNGEEEIDWSVKEENVCIDCYEINDIIKLGFGSRRGINSIGRLFVSNDLNFDPNF